MLQQLNRWYGALWAKAVQLRTRSEEGQGLIEYVLIIALISVAAILVMPTVGAWIVDQFNAIVDALG